jgi:DhnA family fructose-bisphosphate aldolase class Ia
MKKSMTPRVREILSWYGADSPGTLASLARLLNHGKLGGSGKLVILPVDQGFEHGPARSFAMNPDGYDPRYRDATPMPTGGAFGTIMGRNAFQRPKAEGLKLLRETMDIFAGQAKF